MKRFRAILVVLAIAAPLFSDPPSWPQWRGPNGTAVSAGFPHILQATTIEPTHKLRC